MNIYGGVPGGNRNKWLGFGSDWNHNVACPIRNLAISQQIMCGFWWNFHYNYAMIYLSIDWFLGDLDHQADSPDWVYGQNEVIELA